jgi:hypothetical protein
MPFTWPDPISFVADIVTIVAIPTLGVATWNLYKQVKDSRKLRGVTEESVTFYDVAKKTGINVVPFKNVMTVPRVGDHLYLPGETDQHRRYGTGWYEVVSVDFYYRESQELDYPVPATPLVIQVNVRQLADHSN